MKSLNHYLLAIFFMTCASNALAQQAYVGGAFGQADAEVVGIDIGDDSSFKFFGGAKINQNLGFEIGYVDFGEATLTGNGSLTLSASGIDFALMGYIPVGQNVDLFAKLGLLMWDADATFVNVPGFGTGTVSDDGNDINYGFGAIFGVSNNVSIRVSYEMYELDDIDVTNMSIGASVSF